MTSGTRRVLIGAGAAAGTAVLLLALLAVKFRSETSTMSPVPSGMLVEGVNTAKDGFVNVYFVRGREGFTAFDAGNDADNLRIEMRKAGVDPAQVLAVFLTHTDNDHAGGLKILTRARVYISRDEEQMINGSRRRMFLFRNRTIPAYETLEDGQVVKVDGLTVKGILTPGHTPGSMCYLVNGKYLFTGDTLSLKGGSAEPFNEFFNMDTELERKSIGKIASLQGVKYIFTAHYGFTGYTRKAFEKWRK